MEVRGKQGRTPLHAAAADGSTRCLQLLLHRGADTTIRDEMGKTPLELARDAGHVEIEQLLEEAFEEEEEHGNRDRLPSDAYERRLSSFNFSARSDVSARIGGPNFAGRSSDRYTDPEGAALRDTPTASSLESSSARRERTRLQRLRKSFGTSFASGSSKGKAEKTSLANRAGFPYGSSSGAGAVPSASSAANSPRGALPAAYSTSMPVSPRDSRRERAVLLSGPGTTSVPLAGASVTSKAVSHTTSDCEEDPTVASLSSPTSEPAELADF